MNKCMVCHSEFFSKRKDKRVCSKRCAVVFSTRKDIYPRIKRNGHLKCPRCLELKPKNDEHFYQNEDGSFIVSKCISCFKEAVEKRNTKQYILTMRDKKADQEFTSEVGDFILDMKLKRFFAEPADIFKLIHFFDVLYPQATTTNMSMEIQFSIMFEKLARWWKAQKK